MTSSKNDWVIVPLDITTGDEDMLDLTKLSNNQLLCELQRMFKPAEDEITSIGGCEIADETSRARCWKTTCGIVFNEEQKYGKWIETQPCGDVYKFDYASENEDGVVLTRDNNGVRVLLGANGQCLVNGVPFYRGEFIDKASAATSTAECNIVIDFGTAEDCHFIARAVVMAERSHLPKHDHRSMYDHFFQANCTSKEQMFKCIEKFAAVPGVTHFYKNFLIAKDTITGKPVGALACYPHRWEDFFSTAFEGVTEEVLGWSHKQFQRALDSLKWLTEQHHWPHEHIPWDDETCMLDAVFVESEYRCQGICSSLIERCLTMLQEKSCKHVIVLVAMGNEKAKRLYEKYGLEERGKMRSISCSVFLGHQGYHVLVKDM